MRNIHRIFDRYYIGQIFGGDFAKFCGLLRMYELYQKVYVNGLLVVLQKKLTTVKYQITCKVQPKSSDQNNSNIKKNHSMHKGYSRLLEHFFTLFPRPELKLDLRAVNFFSWPVSLLHSSTMPQSR